MSGDVSGGRSLTELGQCGAEAKNCTTTRPDHPVQTFRGGGGVALGRLCESPGGALPSSGVIIILSLKEYLQKI